MSCPDWRSLAAARERLSGDGGTGGADLEREWLSALRHRDDCADCRQRALDADPLLLFRDLPEIDLGPAGVEEMRQRVAGARRMLQASQPMVRRRRPRWPAAAAALLLAIAGGALGPSIFSADPEEPVSATARADLEARPGASLPSDASLEEAERRVQAHLGSLPPVEGPVEVTFRVDGDSFELVQLGSQTGSFGH